MDNAKNKASGYVDEQRAQSDGAAGTATAMAKDPNAQNLQGFTEFTNWFDNLARDNEIVIDYHNSPARVLSLSTDGLITLQFQNPAGTVEAVPFKGELIEQCVIKIAHLLD